MNELAQQLRRAASAYTAGQQTLGDFGREVCQRVATALSVDRVSLWHLDVTGEQPALHCVATFPEPVPAAAPSVTQLVVQDHAEYFHALEAGGVVASEDVQADPLLATLLQAYLKPAGVQALLDAGFLVNGVFFGVLCCEQTSGRRVWTARERVTARRLGSLLSLLLSKAPTWSDSTRRGGLTDWTDLDPGSGDDRAPGDRRRS